MYLMNEIDQNNGSLETKKRLIALANQFNQSETKHNLALKKKWLMEAEVTSDSFKAARLR